MILVTQDSVAMPKAVLSYLTRVKLKSSSPALLTALLSVIAIKNQTHILYSAWQKNEAAASLSSFPWRKLNDKGPLLVKIGGNQNSTIKAQKTFSLKNDLLVVL